MPMKPCECLGLSICELVLDDVRSRNKSLIHLFNIILAPSLPMQFPRLCVFVSLTDGRGEKTARLKILDPEGAEVVSIQGPVRFENPTAIVEMVFEFNNVTFAREGRHEVVFFVENHPIVTRPFVIQRPEREEPDRPS